MKRRLTRRPGFTLIELLVVIVILAMLVGLLLPAVMRAVSAARDAAVASEIQAISQALAAFKSHYGDFPPSRIIVCENGDYSTGPGGNLQGITAALAPRSIAALKRFWPRLSLNTSSAKGKAPNIPAPGFYDVNGNGTIDQNPYILTGPECLVLFLGGVPQSTGSGWSVTGFSKNPQNPFINAATNNNRTVPDYEFAPGRLMTVPSTVNAQGPLSGFPGFLDSLGGAVEPGVVPFYAYFSAYGGAGYDPDDVNMTEPDSASGASPIKGAFMTANSPAATTKLTTTIIGSPGPNPYTSSAPVPTLADSGDIDTGSKKPRAWINQNSYQLISAGRDRYFGIGGQWAQTGTVKLPFIQAVKGYVADSLQTTQANFDVTSQNLGNDVRFREQDNLTNFSGGRLD